MTYQNLFSLCEVYCIIYEGQRLSDIKVPDETQRRFWNHQTIFNKLDLSHLTACETSTLNMLTLALLIMKCCEHISSLNIVSCYSSNSEHVRFAAWKTELSVLKYTIMNKKMTMNTDQIFKTLQTDYTLQ